MLSIPVTCDVTTNAVLKSGPVLWQLDATGNSAANTFEPGEPVEGFRTTVAGSLPIVGRIGVDLHTTLTTTEAVTDSSKMQANSISLSGQTLTAGVEDAFRKNRRH